ncbi:MAG: ATPase, partial [Nitrosopumilus sp.]|nr:ATPase [Nitrosopumilus sp.]
LSFIVSIIAFSTVLILFGYNQSVWEELFLIGIIKGCLGFFVFNYLVRFLYTFEPKNFLYHTRYELVFISILIIDGLIFFTTGFPLVKTILINIGFQNPTGVYVVLMQFFLLVIIFLEFAKASIFINKLALSPASMLMYSFLILICVGTILLMMPQMTSHLQGAPFLTAFFTSTSASCVTGLIVVDTPTYWSLKGQIIIMLLIQAGGLNIVAFAAFFASFSTTGMGIKHQTMMKDMMSAASLLDTKGILRRIFLFAFSIELIGAVAIYSLWGNDILFNSAIEKIYFSIFHSISAFNNAGFALFSAGMASEGANESYILHLVLSVLIFAGGLGFFIMSDLFSIKSMRMRLKHPWRKLTINTRIGLYTAVTLAIGGTVLFYFLEVNNTLEDKKLVPAIITSLFQSVSTRTAGFNSVDFAMLTTPTFILFMFLMFVGGNSGSTAGGIKTSTFAILLISAWSTLRGKKNLEIGKNRISFELLNRAFFVFLFAIGWVLTGIFLLTLTDPQFPIMSIMYEQVSAFGTVGLSTGITPNLSVAGKFIIIVSMFVGRVGPLAVGFALTVRVITTKYSYPKAHLMVG